MAQKKISQEANEILVEMASILSVHLGEKIQDHELLDMYIFEGVARDKKRIQTRVNKFKKGGKNEKI